MDRRTFVGGGALVVGVIAAVPLVGAIRKRVAVEDPLMEPLMLVRFCDEQTIRDIGTAYCKQFPRESRSEELRKRLFASKHETLSATDDNQQIREFLDRKIHDDFEKDDVVSVSGWILARTEAQQCALFSLTA